MVFGGVPFYYELFDSARSLAQNIDNLCFSEGGMLANEYQELYESLFKSPGRYIEVIEALSKKNSGLTRNQIIKETDFSNGGALSTTLDELEQCDFIERYNNFTHKRESMYRLKDPFTLFYFRFMSGNVSDQNYWVNGLASSRRNAWKGVAFEQVCLSHVEQIKKALGIGAVSTAISSWRSRDSAPGAQIDLVISRRDDTINLCEIKYGEAEYVITRKCEEDLRNKREVFRRETGTRSTLHTTMITTYGVSRNKYWETIQSEVTMDDLFS